jgi:hypothetical protein
MLGFWCIKRAALLEPSLAARCCLLEQGWLSIVMIWSIVFVRCAKVILRILQSTVEIDSLKGPNDKLLI